MIQNRKIFTWILLALIAILSITSSFTTVFAKSSLATIQLQIHVPYNSVIKSVTIHDQTQNIQKCFDFIYNNTTSLATPINLATVTFIGTPSTIDTLRPVATLKVLTFNVAAYYKASDSLHIRPFLQPNCKGKAQKNIVGGLLASLKKPLLLGCGKNSLEDLTQSTPQAQDGLDLEELLTPTTTPSICLRPPNI